MPPTWILQLGQFGGILVFAGLVSWVLVAWINANVNKQPDWIKIVQENTSAYMENATANRELAQVIRQQGELISRQTVLVEKQSETIKKQNVLLEKQSECLLKLDTEFRIEAAKRMG